VDAIRLEATKRISELGQRCKSRDEKLGEERKRYDQLKSQAIDKDQELYQLKTEILEYERGNVSKSVCFG